MKIEKISDNQIRCTLSKGDLASREIKISELAYGTEKAKSLFRDMMQQASFEFGFEADDLPLMIEAIPMSSESIVLIITKVDDPEELDTRFSKFSPSYDDDFDDMEELDSLDNTVEPQRADEILELYSEASQTSEDTDTQSYQNLTNLLTESSSEQEKEKKELQSDTNLTRIYSFQNFATIEQLSVILREIYFGKNTLYKNPASKTYYLVLNKSEHSPAEFNKITNIVSEYGTKEAISSEKEAFYLEHYETMIKDSALQILANIL